MKRLATAMLVRLRRWQARHLASYGSPKVLAGFVAFIALLIVAALGLTVVLIVMRQGRP